MRVILASGSPRRIELLQSIVKDFDVLPQNVDETLHYRQPHLAVMNLAKRKIEPIVYSAPQNTLVIGADTIVYFDGKYYNKPRNVSDARRMLYELKGRKHFVYTGVCLYLNGIESTFYVRSAVFMRDLGDSEIDAYIETGSPMDKAGAYGIQDGDIIERYEGSYSNIVGLPTERLKQEIERISEGNDG